MPRTLTIALLSGYQENEDPVFAIRLAAAALRRSYGVNLFLFGNGCNLANQEHPVDGESHMTERLRQHLDTGRVGPELEALAARGANIVTCHTTEYGRGTEGDAYRPGIERGDVGESFAEFVLTSDVLITLGH